MFMEKCLQIYDVNKSLLSSGSKLIKSWYQYGDPSTFFMLKNNAETIQNLDEPKLRILTIIIMLVLKRLMSLSWFFLI